MEDCSINLYIYENNYNKPVSSFQYAMVVTASVSNNSFVLSYKYYDHFYNTWIQVGINTYIKYLN